MKVILINPVCGQGSTGRICQGIADMLRAKGHEAYIAFGLGKTNYIGCYNFSSGRLDYLSHNILSRLTDSEGLHSTNATKRLIKWIESIKPDVVHLHTLHGHYINYKILLQYLYKSNVKVVMTLHDCWAFTGRCAHFDQYGCNKWQTECNKCKHLYAYPCTWFIDRSKHNYRLKKKLFTQFGKKITIVPVSYWLEGLVRKSFLKDLPIQTLHNGIDLSQFHPIINESLYEQYNIRGKKIVLGVALPWSSYKGFPDFLKLREILSDDYAIIMVGLSEQQITELPQGIIGILRTSSTKQLAELYTIADVLVNTTYCDNYPTVNLEAIACGTPVITYKTGGSPEAINKDTGIIVSQGNLNELVNAIYSITNKEKSFISMKCVSYAKEYFDKNKCFDMYMKIFEAK